MRFISFGCLRINALYQWRYHVSIHFIAVGNSGQCAVAYDIHSTSSNSSQARHQHCIGSYFLMFVINKENFQVLHGFIYTLAIFPSG